MLIDFTVENYRSIKDPVTLSAIAKPSRARGNTRQPWIMPDNEIAPPFVVEGRGFELLPVLGLFGANASGKSNVIRALDSVLGFMAHGVVDDYNISRSYMPFQLSNTASNLPTKLQLRLVIEGTIYIYTVHVIQDSILLERLEYIPPLPRRSQRLLFERRRDDEKDSYYWKNGADFIGPHTQLEKSLSKNQPYLSLLIRSLVVKGLEPFRQWMFQRQVGISLGNEEFDFRRAVLFCRSEPDLLSNAAAIVNRFDTAIANIEIENRNGGAEMAAYHIIVVHKTDFGKVRWPIEEESLGTQRLFILAVRILISLQSGTLLTVDEIGSNIHPNITHEIVRLFQDPKTNPKRAQLIFTSHDNTLMQRNLLRRDQIWFTQKREDGSTELYPLTDFKPRNDLAIDRAYLDGRFEAVPFLPDTEDLLAELEPAA